MPVADEVAKLDNNSHKGNSRLMTRSHLRETSKRTYPNTLNMQYANQVCLMAGQAARHLKMCQCMWK